MKKLLIGTLKYSIIIGLMTYLIYDAYIPISMLLFYVICSNKKDSRLKSLIASVMVRGGSREM